MRQWQCKCGKLQAFGSDSPAPCLKCEHCGTSVYQGAVADHDFIILYDQYNGFPYQVCNSCRMKVHHKPDTSFKIPKEIKWTVEDFKDFYLTLMDFKKRFLQRHGAEVK